MDFASIESKKNSQYFSVRGIIMEANKIVKNENFPEKSEISHDNTFEKIM